MLTADVKKIKKNVLYNITLIFDVLSENVITFVRSQLFLKKILLIK